MKLTTLTIACAHAGIISRLTKTMRKGQNTERCLRHAGNTISQTMESTGFSSRLRGRGKPLGVVLGEVFRELARLWARGAAYRMLLVIVGMPLFVLTGAAAWVIGDYVSDLF